MRRTTLCLWLTWTFDSPFTLLPGRYTARFTLFDGRQNEIPFRLVAGEPAPPITVRWPR